MLEFLQRLAARFGAGEGLESKLIATAVVLVSYDAKSLPDRTGRAPPGEPGHLVGGFRRRQSQPHVLGHYGRYGRGPTGHRRRH